MVEETKEYATFFVQTKEGDTIEMAIIDEFEFEHKQYLTGAVIDDDTIIEDGIYIYKAKVTDEEVIPEKITNAADYQRVADAYLALDTELQEE